MAAIESLEVIIINYARNLFIILFGFNLCLQPILADTGPDSGRQKLQSAVAEQWVLNFGVPNFTVLKLRIST